MIKVAALQKRLQSVGIQFNAGLSDIELKQIENTYNFRFPPDLREFLGYALPVSNLFINWREATETEIRERLSWPLEGICFDIKNNAFWLKSWGERPSSDVEACSIARTAVNSAPVLIPIYSHRSIPDRPHESGNPVLSVHQTDIIYYGIDLFDYFENEFFRNSEERTRREKSLYYESYKKIEFWSHIIENWQVL